jgi:subtilase family serine protease
VDDNDLIELKGNTHPLARPQFDQGAAPADLPMNRMLLLLSHTREQEADANTLIEQQQDSSSANFHQWLTPDQYGERFGATPGEIQSVTGWLQSHGFLVAKVAKGRHVIEFSGTAAQVQEALHTSIHKYVVKGEEHWANASNAQIPTALAPVIAGVVSLHNFRKKRATSFVADCSGGLNFPNCFAGLSPYDFAAIYNLKTLWDEGIDGTGQSVAIVARSNINLQDVRNFRKLFGLPPNDPQVILDGPDPGLLLASSDELENVVDTTWSGAAAKNATIKVVVSASTDATDGLDLSAQYIIENNVAPVMTTSYGGCELVLGTVGNQFEYNLWQQAATQGITAIVVAGDTGSAECEEGAKFSESVTQLGFNVNGLASTPYDVAVGGTDFNDISNFLKYWSSTNDPKTKASVLSYIPETAWNDSCANPIWSDVGFSADPIVNCNNPNIIDWLGYSALNVFAGSGGPSSCTINDTVVLQGELGGNFYGDLSSCQGGYPKPPWQRGVGVPADGKRDIPDVSLFAGTITQGVGYAFCESDIGVSCDPNAPTMGIGIISGTSLAGPSFAGIMALVNQKTHSRQGNANYVFYKLAAEEPAANCNSTLGPASTCIFNDITFGTNALPCGAGTPNCATEGNLPVGVLTGYNAGVGYDLATGLGSINAYNLVHRWKSVTFDRTNTHLALSPTAIVHGQLVNVNIAVTSSDGTPTGQVSLIASNTTSTLNNQSGGDFTLGKNGTVSSSTQLLPGGSYSVRAHYGGDGEYGQSDSNYIPVRVAPEPSTTVASALLCGVSVFSCAIGAPFSTAPYGTYVFIRADVAGKSGFGFATGTVYFTDVDEQPLAGDPFSLNSFSYVETPYGVTNFTPRMHRIRASYSGDSSFLRSASAPVSFTITQAPTQTALTASAGAAVAGASVTLSATVSTSSYGNPPTGKVAFFSGAKLLAPPVAVIGSVDPIAGTAVATASLTTTRLPVGQDSVAAKYIGDENYTGSISTPVAINVTKQ